jgi:hypothetical protein
LLKKKFEKIDFGIKIGYRISLLDYFFEWGATCDDFDVFRGIKIFIDHGLHIFIERRGE